MNFVVREATEADLPAIAAIYDREIETGVATFDNEVRGVEPWVLRLAEGPLVVGCNAGDTGEDGAAGAVGAVGVVGFAYASWHRPRWGYRHTREVSVYLAPQAQGQGLGRALYDDLLPRLDAAGIHRLIAVIALPNPASVRLHESCGFTQVGTLTEVGHKFGRWIDIGMFERALR